MTQAVFPARLLYCAGPTMIEAAAALVRAREQAWAVQWPRTAL